MMIRSRLAQRMLDDLQLAGHSPGTQDRYLKTVRGLAKHFQLSPDKITEGQLRQYLLFLKNERRLAAGTLKIVYYGIRFFYSRTVKRDWPTLQKLRVPTEHKLPAVMSINEDCPSLSAAIVCLTSSLCRPIFLPMRLYISTELTRLISV